MKKEDPTSEEIIKQLRLQNDEVKKELEKQQAEKEKSTESDSRFEAIFNQSMLGNKIIDPDLTIIQVNAALVQMLGHSEEELIGHKIIEFSHPDFIHHWQKLQKNLWEGEIPAFQIETCLKKKDGSFLWCQATSTLFQDKGQSLGFTSLEDISNRRSLELELKKQYDNQETIMHMVAHDLKSPLHNIQLAATFLKENLEELLAKEKEKQKESFTFVDLISDTTGKALRIIDDLLIIGELESTNLGQEEVDLNHLIKTYLTSASLRAQNKDIKIQVKAPEQPIKAFVDPEKFRRVLENILSNAIKFSKPHGEVTITLQKEQGKALILIQDNGIGIPEKLQPIIFNKFTKSKRTGTDGEPTTGLGLFIVKQIIEKQGGQIWVESKENVGTTFSIQLCST